MTAKVKKPDPAALPAKVADPKPVVAAAPASKTKTSQVVSLGAPPQNMPWSYEPGAPGGSVSNFPVSPSPDLVLLNKEQIDALPTPCVVINGVVIEPKHTELDGGFGRISVPHSNASFYIPYSEDRSKGANVFSYYAVELNGNKVGYYLDKRSKVVITNTGGPFGRYGDDYENYGKGGQLMLINSSSENDSVMGDSTLRNVASVENTFFKSSVSNTANTPGATPSYMAPKKDDTDNDRQFPMKGCHLRESYIQDSVLPNGRFVKASITKSRLVSQRWVLVKDVYMTECTIEAKSIVLTGLTVKNFSAYIEGECVIRNNQSFNGDTLTAQSIYAPNKFCLLKVDFPNRELNVVRLNYKEIGLGFYSGFVVVISVNANREEIEAAMNKLTKADHRDDFSPHDVHGINNAFSQSLLDYAINSIDSRLGVIRMLDAATKSVEEMTRAYDPDGSFPF